MPPTHHISLDEQGRITTVPFRRKMRGVDYQRVFILPRFAQVLTRLEIDQTKRALAGLF